MSFTINIAYMNSQIIHCNVKPKHYEEFDYTFVHGFNDQNSRMQLWSCLKGFASNNSEPWILLGDFKALSNMDDRIGLVVRYAEIAPILDCLRTCNLMDFKATGKHFTWTNKQDRNQRVFSRIYIVLANSGWIDKYSMSEVVFLPEGNFDHTPMLLSMYTDANYKKPLRFHNMWCNPNSMLETVTWIQQALAKGFVMYRVQQKLKKVKEALKLLNKTGFGDVDVAIIKARMALVEAHDAMHRDPGNSMLVSREKADTGVLQVAIHNQVSLLKQKSKIA